MPAFIHTIEVDGESTYKKMGYIKPHHRLYNFVKKHQHKDEVNFSFSNQCINSSIGNEIRQMIVGIDRWGRGEGGLGRKGREGGGGGREGGGGGREGGTEGGKGGREEGREGGGRGEGEGEEGEEVLGSRKHLIKKV